MCFFIGTIFTTVIEFGLSYASSLTSMSWTLPLALQGLPSLIILIFIGFTPGILLQEMLQKLTKFLYTTVGTVILIV